jgi:hypothetical protein
MVAYLTWLESLVLSGLLSRVVWSLIFNDGERELAQEPSAVLSSLKIKCDWYGTSWDPVVREVCTSPSVTGWRSSLVCSCLQQLQSVPGRKQFVIIWSSRQLKCPWPKVVSCHVVFEDSAKSFITDGKHFPFVTFLRMMIIEFYSLNVFLVVAFTTLLPFDEMLFLGCLVTLDVWWW